VVIAVARMPGLSARGTIGPEVADGLGDVEAAQPGDERVPHAPDHRERVVGGSRHPDRWVGLLIGPRHHREIVEREVFSGVREAVLRPRLQDDVERFLEALAALVVADAVARVGAGKAAAPDAEVEATLADLIDRGGFLGGADGVTERKHADAGADAQALRA